MGNQVKFNENYPAITKSLALLERGLQVQKPITQTLAKGPGQFSKGVAPVYLQKGKGARVWDVDGNEYIDFNMGIGPLSLGYCIPEIDEAIKQQLEEGITFSLMHPLEVEVAEMVHEIIPNAEVVKFSKTGAMQWGINAYLVDEVLEVIPDKIKILGCRIKCINDFSNRKIPIPNKLRDLGVTAVGRTNESIVCWIHLDETTKGEIKEKSDKVCKAMGLNRAKAKFDFIILSNGEANARFEQTTKEMQAIGQSDKRLKQRILGRCVS